jgi:hypothetical protein
VRGWVYEVDVAGRLKLAAGLLILGVLMAGIPVIPIAIRTICLAFAGLWIGAVAIRWALRSIGTLFRRPPS